MAGLSTPFQHYLDHKASNGSFLQNNHLIMKKNAFKLMVATAFLSFAIQFSSCKGKNSESTTDTTVKAADTTTTAAAPVTIAADDDLTKGVKDATKDFPGVTAEVKDGEINLTGDITRDKLPTLMQSLSTLHPKKINNSLTIKK